MICAKTILIVDPDAIGAERRADRLRSHGRWHIIVGPDGAAARLALLPGAVPIDAWLISAELPDVDANALCAEFRDRGVQVPILLFAQGAAEAQAVAGLRSGANDFIRLPCGDAELQARLDAQMQAFDRSEHAVLRIGPYQFQPTARLMVHSTTRERVRLTGLETSMLKYLYHAQGAPVPRRTLLNEVWGYRPTISSHTVETHIYRLRRKIEPEPGEIGLLVKRNGGYCLNLNDDRRPRAALATAA